MVNIPFPIGPELNQIVGVLKNVPWIGLAGELNLQQETDIHEVCKNDRQPATCGMRKVVIGFIDSQPPQSCCDIVEMIATALGKLIPPHVREASKLRKMYNIGEKTLFLDIVFIMHNRVAIGVCM